MALEYLDCFTLPHLLQPSFDQLFSCIVERVIDNIQWRGLELGFESTPNGGKDYVPKEQPKDGGQDRGFRMESIPDKIDCRKEGLCG